MRRDAIPPRMRDIARRLIWFVALWMAGVAIVGAAAFVLRGMLL